MRRVTLRRVSCRGCARDKEACGWPCPLPAQRRRRTPAAEASGGHIPALLSIALRRFPPAFQNESGACSSPRSRATCRPGACHAAAALEMRRHADGLARGRRGSRALPWRRVAATSLPSFQIALRRFPPAFQTRAGAWSSPRSCAACRSGACHAEAALDMCRHVHGLARSRCGRRAPLRHIPALLLDCTSPHSASFSNESWACSNPRSCALYRSGACHAGAALETWRHVDCLARGRRGAWPSAPTCRDAWVLDQQCTAPTRMRTRRRLRLR